MMMSDHSSTNRKERLKILNQMLIDWVSGMKLKRSKGKKKWHSPASINVTIRKFFSACKEYCGWDYTISEFAFEGGFNGFFMSLCEKRQKIDVSKMNEEEHCCDKSFFLFIHSPFSLFFLFLANLWNEEGRLSSLRIRSRKNQVRNI